MDNSKGEQVSLLLCEGCTKLVDWLDLKQLAGLSEFELVGELNRLVG